MKLYVCIARLVLGAAVLVVPTAAPAQTAASSDQIVGQVLDKTGAAIAGAEVSVRNRDTNQSRKGTTDDSGRYAVSLLLPAPGLTPTVEDVSPV